MDKAKWTAELSECLRTYDTLGLWRDAEDVLRRDVMRAFIKKVRSLQSPSQALILTTPSVDNIPRHTHQPPLAPPPPHTVRILAPTSNAVHSIHRVRLKEEPIRGGLLYPVAVASSNTPPRRRRRSPSQGLQPNAAIRRSRLE